MITERHIRMINPRGFDDLFWETVGEGLSHEKAFERLNGQYRKAFGHDRYANFESYRQSLRQRIKSPK